MTDIFTLTTRPDTALFFQRGEDGDPRLGEIVRHAPEEYAAAKLVLLGCPQDEGVRRNGGRVGAAGAPTEIRRYLYRLIAKTSWAGKFFDLGDTMIQPTLEETHTVHQQIVEHLLRDEKIVIVLGGGNDISYPDAAAMAAVQAGQPFLAVNIDAHLDVRESEQRHSGTPYRQLLEEGHITPNWFYEIGGQHFAISYEHLNYIRKKGATFISMSKIREPDENISLWDIVPPARAENNGAFWGFDLDAVTAADAPGVSAPNVAGFAAHEFLTLCAVAANRESSRLLIEFSEVNPTYDIDGRTSRLVAAGIWTIFNQLL